MHHVTRLLETNDYVRCLLVDFSKAFGAVSHVLLIRKLQKLNIPPFVINWIINFLTDRHHAVIIDGKNSFKMSITRSIVQGSGLGRFLFIIYILDLRPLSVVNLMYADDLIIMPAFLYCAAYTRMTMNGSSPLSEQRRISFNDDGQTVQLAWPELPAPHYICMYRLLPTTPPSPSRHYYLRLISGTNLPTPKGWIAWLAKADFKQITFAQGYYTIGFKGTRRKWTQVVGSKTNSIPVNQLRHTL